MGKAYMDRKRWNRVVVNDNSITQNVALNGDCARFRTTMRVVFQPH